MHFVTFPERVAADFSPHGALTTSLDHFEQRQAQTDLAIEIAEALDQGVMLLAEAGTGTGKTLAYLVPALRSNEKVLISTHTKALQDQLMFRDLPAVQKALGATRRVALLKGRHNYLCPARLQQHLTSAQVEMWAQKSLLHVLDWSKKSRDGDLSGLGFDVHEKGIGAMVTASSEQCTGSKCGDFHQCPLMKARQKAMEADIVISNHSLLLADAALKSSEYGEILPQFDAYVLDEAHSLPALACQHFGVTLTRLRLITWLNDMQTALEEMGDESDLGRDIVLHGRKVLKSWLEDSINPVHEQWQQFVIWSESRKDRSDDLARMFERAQEIDMDMQRVMQPASGFVSWSEGEGERRRYQVAPVKTGPVLDQHLWSRDAAFILLSATLRVSDSFDYAKHRLGNAEAKTTHHPSPFDYATQAMTYLPRHLHDTRSDEGQMMMVDEMETLLRASQGRAFVLFTSWYMLQKVAPILQERLPWNLYIQGAGESKDLMLEKFRNDRHSILCGTRSFWEGVDVPGDALSLVIVDKIPFAPPNDPLLMARIADCEAQGGNGFMDIQLPEAIAILRQGVGRLIRAHSDHGVMAILDSRIYGKRYGKEIMNNMPPAPVVVDIAEIRWFFEGLDH
ncbi:MAG: ATP-dependent DNA helicase [Zetaproteobacteria bacterium]|nr:ATP-dependent DNA helicase [Zetaproteobacteria bacterium]